MSKLGDEPAYPVACSTGMRHLIERGMTKREQIAAMTMQGMLANCNETFDETSPARFALTAVCYADALLAELDKPAEGTTDANG